MTANDKAKVLREMAAKWLRRAEDTQTFGPPQDSDYYRARAALLASGAEALERLESVKSATRNAYDSQ